MVYRIYCLKHPLTNSVFYIGCTTAKLIARLSQHLYDCKIKNNLKTNYIQLLLNDNLIPNIELLKETDESNWIKEEQYYITLYSNLVNKNKGGSGIILNRSSESIGKSSKAKFRKVIQLDLNGNFIKEWESISEIEKKLNIIKTALGNCLKKRSKTAGGFIWIYKEKYNSETFLKSKDKRERTIVQFNSEMKILKEYSNIKEASIEHNLNQSYISAVLNNRIKKPKIIFKYKSEDIV